jgi:hypothetical protein
MIVANKRAVSRMKGIDMATLGIMCMAMNKTAHRHLSRQFELRQTPPASALLILSPQRRWSLTVTYRSKRLKSGGIFPIQN